MVESLPAGKTATAVPIVDQKIASQKLSTLYTLHRPQAPAGMKVTTQAGSETRDLIYFVNRQIRRGTAPVTDGALEHWLESNLFVRGMLPAGMFIGIAAPSEDAVPVDQYQMVDSVRYIVGTLP